MVNGEGVGVNLFGGFKHVVSCASRCTIKALVESNWF